MHVNEICVNPFEGENDVAETIPEAPFSLSTAIPSSETREPVSPLMEIYLDESVTVNFNCTLDPLTTFSAVTPDISL